MASSVFTDSVVSTNDSLVRAGDSNLVVVYGKSGVSVDRDELDELLEDGNVSSVSVVRIMSPTPSMKDEEQNEDEGIDGDNSDLISTLESGDASCEKPEIVGLTVEEFYPREEAKKLAKDILNYAGVSNPLQIKIDYEFQRFVIQNDHCYTPLTSPSQNTKKTAALTDLPVPVSDGVGKQQPSSIRHYAATARLAKKSAEAVPDAAAAAAADEKKPDSEEDDEEYSDYSESSPSESDNDRDSDLDFNVNDRGRRRKTGGRKKRKSINKPPKKRQSITEKDVDEEPKKITATARGGRQSISTPGSQKAVQRTATVANPKVTIKVVQRQDLDKTGEQKVTAGLPAQKLLQQRQHLQQRQIQQQQIQMQVLQQQQLIQQKMQQEQQKVLAQKVYLLKKEVNVRAADSGFSEPENSVPKPVVTQQLQQQQQQQQQQIKVHVVHRLTALPHLQPIQQQPLPPPPPQYSQQLVTATKGFMPLGVETAAKNQLPAQISIQTHTSSTELAIENDKQLDLIDSIVKDELEKPSVISKDVKVGAAVSGANADIPQIVKMLESTESVVMNKAKAAADASVIPSSSSAAAATTSFTNPDEHFDITNADLLDNPDDDLYKDLLQHVAELRNDKQLHDVIEKQGVFDPSSSSSNQQQIDLDSSASAQQLMHGTVLVDSTGTPVRKDPIKIVRGDGRVITLPPIEAPTTRAKRRAQVQPSPAITPTVTAEAEPAVSLAVISKPVANLVKNETATPRRQSGEQRAAAVAAATVATGSKKRNSVSSQSTIKDDDGTTETEQEDEDDPDKLWCICRQPHNNRFMICCDKCEDWFHGTCVNITKAMGREMENTGKEWTCPNCVKDKKKSSQKKITDIFDKKPSPAAPKKFPELKKISPTPPGKKSMAKKRQKSDSILKSPIEGNQKKISDILKPKPATTAAVPATAAAATPTSPPPLVKSVTVQVTEAKPQQQPDVAAVPKPKVDPTHSCIVCKKPARQNSIYCSDDCIRKHAHNALVTANKAAKAAAAAAAAATSPAVPLTPEEKKKKIQSTFEEALARAEAPTVPVKHKVERVYVFERKTGRILTGTNAPTTVNLKKWLQENPTFEVVQPGSPEALAIERSKQRHQKMPVKLEPIPTPAAKRPAAEPKPEAKPEPKLPKLQLHELAIRSTHPLKKYPQQVSIKLPSSILPTPTTTEPKTPTAKTPRKSSTQSSSASSSSAEKTTAQQSNTAATAAAAAAVAASDSEPIRLNVRKTFKEQLITRMNEMNLPEAKRLRLAEIESFSTEVEGEMFALFNKDCGAKYKAKYRSLMFNIKDRKNQTLFQKIVEKKIGPRQLVRMSPEELASQELAQWRQNENKHQLEMIKKSELDLLSCAKNYVLKTHKGEEVIEDKATDRVSLDMGIPVEDVVTVLNNSAVSSTSELNASSALSNKDPGKIQSPSEGSSQDADSSFAALTDSSKTSSAAPPDRKKIKKHEKDRDRHSRSSKDKHRSMRRHSRSRSRDRRHKSPHRDEKRKSPTHREERHKSSPHREERHKSPLHREERHKSPSHREERHKSPLHREERHKSPSHREERHKSPLHREERHKSPLHREERHKSPLHREERHKSPSHREDRYKSPPHREERSYRSEKVKSPHSENSEDDKIEVRHKKVESKKRPATTQLKPKSKRPIKIRISREKTVAVVTAAAEAAKSTTCNLIDQILESTKTIEEAANMVSEKTELKSAVSTTTLSSVSTTAAGIQAVASSKPIESSPDSDQEPTSTVNIPTTTEDQYKRYASDLAKIIWSGSINMIDVATFQIAIQPVVGVIIDLDKQLPGELDVVGRISPDTVWDYITKIKKSPNKEIVIVRLIPSCETENTAYSALYMYLDNRRRLGVVKTVSPNTKDFYILPLGAGKRLPAVLQPQEQVAFFEDETRPDLLLGIIVRIMGKRNATGSGHHSHSKIARKSSEQTTVISSNMAVSSEDRYTPPSSPKMLTGKKADSKSIISASLRLPPKVDESIDISAIITPPTKNQKAYSGDDADEPYSPGDSSEDDALLLPATGASNSTGNAMDSIADDDLKRKMDEINRQIEARKMEIAGMLGMDQNSTAYDPANPTDMNPALANISIPSNLQQILASIKPTQDSNTTATSASAPPPPAIGPLSAEDDEEYVPEPAAPAKLYKPCPPPPQPPSILLTPETAMSTGGSRLAQLSEAELLSMVPDDVELDSDKSSSMNDSTTITADGGSNTTRWSKEPPPPGLEEEFN